MLEPRKQTVDGRVVTMLRLGIGVFLALHGLVHLWYVVLSQGWVEVEDQMGTTVPSKASTNWR